MLAVSAAANAVPPPDETMRAEEIAGALVERQDENRCCACEAAVVKWPMWWMGAKDRIAHDRAAKRLVVP